MTTTILRCMGSVRGPAQRSQIIRPKYLQCAPFRSTSWLQRGSRSSYATAPNKRVTPQAPPKPPASAMPRYREGPQLAVAAHYARKANPTTLYEAAPNRVFVFSAYTAGATCLACAGVNFLFNVTYLPEGAPAWAPYVFAPISLMMAALGTRFALAPASSVRSIRILPTLAPSTTTAATASKTPSVAQKAAKSAKSPSTTANPTKIKIEVIARRNVPIPFMNKKRFEVEPHEIVLKHRLYDFAQSVAAGHTHDSAAARQPRGSPPQTAQQILAAQQAEKERREAARQYELDHLMTAPFRHGAQHTSTIFSAIRRSLSGEGFVPVEIRGVKYKLDVSTAYALEQGRVLDRVCAVDEDVPEVPKQQQRR